MQKRLVALIGALRRARLRRSSTGARGERAAADHLRRKGCRIVARNLRNRYGEIDLVALAPDGRTVLIVEVKTAESADARPERRVDARKQHRLTALAAQLVRRYRLADKPIRFDVVAVNLPPEAEPSIRHYEGAFVSAV